MKHPRYPMLLLIVGAILSPAVVAVTIDGQRQTRVQQLYSNVSQGLQQVAANAQRSGMEKPIRYVPTYADEKAKPEKEEEEGGGWAMPDDSFLLVMVGIGVLLIVMLVAIICFIQRRSEPEQTEPSGVDLDKEVNMLKIFQDSASKLSSQLATMDKGDGVRGILEDTAQGLPDKAKNFVIQEMNDVADDVLKAIEEEETAMLIDFNNAVEASFPPLPVLLAGVASGALLSLELTWHTIVLYLHFLPVFLGTVWALYVDWGSTCFLPTMNAWVWCACATTLVLVLGHGLLSSRISSGQQAQSQKTAEIRARLVNNAADGETSFSDMQDMMIGSAVMVQEALLLEDSVRTSPWNTAIGFGTLIWIFVATWNCILVIGWTFDPRAIAFHEKAKAVAGDEYCGAWASVFLARIVCILTPLFFFLNLMEAIRWTCVTVLHSNTVSSMLLSYTKGFDERHGGIPVAQIIVKGFLLRGSTDTAMAKLTVELGEAIRLSREMSDLQDELKGVKQRLGAGQEERRALRSISDKTLKAKESMALEEALAEGGEALNEMKSQGQQLVVQALATIEDSRMASTQKLEKLMELMTELAEQARIHEAIAAAQQGAFTAMEQARSHVEAGVAMAQSPEMQARLNSTLAQAREASTAGLAQAQQQMQAGIAYAQSEEAQASLAAARDSAVGQASRMQATVQQGAAYAQSEEARAAVVGQAKAAAAQASQAAAGAQQQAQAAAAQAARLSSEAQQQVKRKPGEKHG